MSREKLTPVQASVLIALQMAANSMGRPTGMEQRLIARKIVTTTGGAGRALWILHGRGLVRGTDDGRWCITPAGAAAIAPPESTEEKP